LRNEKRANEFIQCHFGGESLVLYNGPCLGTEDRAATDWPRDPPMSVNLNTKATAVALLVVAGLSWPAQAEMMALRCEGTKTTIPKAKEPDLVKRWGRDWGVGEDPDIPTTLKTEPSSTDVIVTDEIVHAFGMELETGFINDAFATFVYEKRNPVLTNFALDSFTGRINRITGVLEATWLKYKKSGWLYLEVKYSLNCRKVERKF